ncbi:MAG: HAMP domain-containing sensor histidine kinase [Candidatus Peribacteraceae bacterium]
MEKQTQSPFLRWVGYVGIIASIIVTVAVSLVLYEHTVNLLTENLRQRLLAIVKTAATQINTADLDVLHELEDYKKPEYQRVVKQLIAMRENNEDIVFMYILRKAEKNPEQMVFVADSHSLDPFAKIDLNGDGIIDKADALNYPGDVYEDVPEEAFLGYNGPTTNKDLYEDQWGMLLSGYVPIYRADKTVAGVMTVDVRADNFFKITKQTLYPFLAFIATLVLILLILASGLIHIWNRRITLFAQLDRQKDELINIVSHQLASPISAVKWSLQDMLDGEFGEVNDEQKKHLREDMGTTRNLLELAELLLDVSRIELGRLKMNKQRQSLAEFFREIVVVIEQKAKEKGVLFSPVLPEVLSDGTFDKRLTHMTIENLLTNAVKYTSSGGSVELKVEMRGNILSCMVKDTGIGIPKKDQAQLFGKLFRASNVQKIDGNGFGLYVAKGAIEQQGGKIWFESEEGKGTAFFIELPV